MFNSPAKTKESSVTTRRQDAAMAGETNAPASVFQFGTWFRADPVKSSLILGLAFLSWLATYTGMLELIKANTRDLSFGVHVAIAFAVAMLMLMILYLLDSLFSETTPTWLKPVFVVGYAFLTLISVGFGFGFYWKYLEARSEATRSAGSAVSQVQIALEQGKTRLEQLQQTLTSLTFISSKKAEQERVKGGTCQNSPPGDGPRRKMRDADAQSFNQAGEFIGSRIGTVRTDFNALNVDLKRVLSNDRTTIDPRTGTRNIFLRSLGRKLDLTIARFNALRSDPQLKVYRDSFDARSKQTVFPNTRGGTYKCPDPQLQTALRGVVRAIDGLPVIGKAEIAAVEGSEAIVEAFRRLTNTLIGAIRLKLPPGPDELRNKRTAAIQSARNLSSGKKQDTETAVGLGTRDYIPLFIAIFVDLCILLISLNRQINRMAVIKSRMEIARQGRFDEILKRLEEYHRLGRHKGVNLLSEIIFDAHGDYFAAVPLMEYEDRKTIAGNGQYAQAMPPHYQQMHTHQPHMQNGRPQIQENGGGEPISRHQLGRDARFLANLFMSLEGMGIVNRISFGRHFLTRASKREEYLKGRLKKQGSVFKDAGDYRIYRFRKDVLSSVMLDAILGAAHDIKRIEEHGRWNAEQNAVEQAKKREHQQFRERTELAEQADQSRILQKRQELALDLQREREKNDLLKERLQLQKDAARVDKGPGLLARMGGFLTRSSADSANSSAPAAQTTPDIPVSGGKDDEIHVTRLDGHLDDGDVDAEARTKELNGKADRLAGVTPGDSLAGRVAATEGDASDQDLVARRERLEETPIPVAADRKIYANRMNSSTGSTGLPENGVHHRPSEISPSEHNSLVSRISSIGRVGQELRKAAEGRDGNKAGGATPASKLIGGYKMPANGNTTDLQGIPQAESGDFAKVNENNVIPHEGFIGSRQIAPAPASDSGGVIVAQAAAAAVAHKQPGEVSAPPFGPAQRTTAGAALNDIVVASQSGTAPPVVNVQVNIPAGSIPGGELPHAYRPAQPARPSPGDTARPVDARVIDANAVNEARNKQIEAEMMEDVRPGAKPLTELLNNMTSFKRE